MYKSLKFDQIDKQMINSTVKSINDVFPIVGKKHRIELKGISIKEGEDAFDFAGQKDAIDKKKTWGSKLVGNLVLKDSSGKVIDTQKATIGTIPRMTPRGTFIIDGKENIVKNQFRLRPGAYTVKKPGDLIVTSFNMAVGRKQFKDLRITTRPKTGKIELSFFNRHYPIYPILKAFNISDGQISEALGASLYNANVTSNTEQHIYKLAKDITGDSHESVNAAALSIKNALGNVSFEKGANEMLLGKNYQTVDAPFLMSVLRKNIGVLRGDDKPDDRNNISFKNIYTVADNLRERLDHNRYDMQKNIKQKIDTHDTVSKVIAGNKIGKIILGLFKQGELKEYAKQTNPLTWIDNLTSVTLGGTGGIQSSRQVKPEDAYLQPSSIGFLDPIQSSESSEDIGTKFHFAAGSEIVNGELKTEVIRRTGRKTYLTPAQIFNSRVILPGQTGKQTVKITYRGEIYEGKRSEGDYEYPDPSRIFSPLSNTIPFLSSTYVKRANVGVKQSTQALPLVAREEPLVQTDIDKKLSPMEDIARNVNSYSTIDGTVTKVDENNFKIHIKGEDGKTVKIPFYKNFPLNFESFIDSRLLVNKGSKVKKGQLLAESNYSRGLNLATGINLLTAFLPYKGLNFEDGFVISESAAKKLTSVHMHKFEIDRTRNDLLNLSSFVLNFPATIKDMDLSNYDKDGVIKKGSIVQPGEPLIFHATEKELSPSDIALGKFHKLLRTPYQENVVVNNISVPGEIIDVIKTSKGARVYLKTLEPAQVGDKIASRMGGKGVITRVISDNEMPRTKDQKIIDLMFNPIGIPSRMNPSQVLEIGAAKAAERKGRPVLVKNFMDMDNVKLVKNMMKDVGVTDKEELIDPETKKSIGEVAVGPMYIHKLHHSVRDKVKTRDFGTYNINELPSKHGDDSSQKMDALGFYAMLAHGARANLAEMSNWKAGKNEEFWRAVQLGYPLPAIKTPFVVDKLQKNLMALGVNLEKKGNNLYMTPFSDKMALQLSGGEIKGKGGRVGFLRARDYMPDKGGFFDPEVTGGLFGEKWSHIKLNRPLPSPLYESAISSILGIQIKDIERIVSGETGITKDGKISLDAPTGAHALYDALENVDVLKELENTRKLALKEASSKDKIRLDYYNKKLRYLRNLKDTGSHPHEVYTQQIVPVLPPMYRPIYALPNNTVQTTPINYLYRDLWLQNNAVKELKDKGMPDFITLPEEGTTYRALKALVGLTDPINVQSKQKGAVGFMDFIHGVGSPKTGFLQKDILSKRQDMTMRSVITVDPSLGIDEVGLPREELWTLYRPFIIRELVKKGYNILDAQEAVRERTQTAEDALNDVSSDRPVLVTRDPKLHKFNIIAQKTKPVSGEAIRLSPLVVSGLNADFDGDQMAVHVPVTEAAKEEAKKMFPSKNMFGAGGSVINMPAHEAQWGLAEITTAGKKTNKEFPTKQRALHAYRKGEIDITDVIRVDGQKVTVGKVLVNESIPKKFRDYEIVFDKKNTRKKAKEVIMSRPADVPKMVNTWKDIGNDYAFRHGFTIGIDDLSLSPSVRDRLAKEAEIKVRASVNKEEQSQKLGDPVNKKFFTTLDKSALNKNNIYKMMESGARGDMGNFRQILGVYGTMPGPGNKPLPYFNPQNYGSGMTFPNYLGTLFPGRESIVATAKGVPLGGELAKETVNSSIDVVISEEDCGTTSGIFIDREDEKQLIGRYEVGKEKRGPIRSSRDIKTKKAKIRSPITCETSDGVCKMCYGLNDNFAPPKIGDNIGVHAATSLSEPVTQMMLRQFHAGAGTAKELGSAYDYARGLFFMPENIKGKATLSTQTGIIEAIKPAPAGGKFIYINGEEHFVPENRELVVKKGQAIEKGEQISSGIPHPKEIFKLKGVDDARTKMLGAVRNIYDIAGININPHHHETLVRSLTNQTRVIDPGESDYEPGDVALYSEVKRINKDLKLPIIHEPYIRGAKNIPTLKRDFLTQMGRKELKKAIQHGVAQGWVSHIRGHSPLNPWLLGEFREEIGPRGEY